MRTFRVLKYELEPASTGDKSVACKLIEIPKESQLLDAEFMDGKIYVWALIDVEMAKAHPMEKKQFYAVPTGLEVSFEPKARYFRTVCDLADGLVFHIFHDAW